MADETPQPVPGVKLIPRLLAYQIARQCEEEEVKGIISIIMNENDTWSVQVSHGVKACEVAFAAGMLMEDALKLSKSWPDEDAEEDEE